MIAILGSLLGRGNSDRIDNQVLIAVSRVSGVCVFRRGGERRGIARVVVLNVVVFLIKPGASRSRQWGASVVMIPIMISSHSENKRQNWPRSDGGIYKSGSFGAPVESW